MRDQEINMLREEAAVDLASLMPASWNQITEWLRVLEGLRRAS